MPLLKTACAAALSVVCLFINCAQARAAGPASVERAAAPSAEARRAERLIAKLRQIERAGDDFDAFREAFERLYPGLFDEAAGLREGELKTDLSSAVFLYEAAYRLWRAGDARRAACQDEPRDLYRSLCLAQGGPTRAQLLRAKARLHTRWAEAVVVHAAGRRDAATLDALDAMRRERALDTALAARAVGALRSLGVFVRAYPSLADFEEGGTLADVSVEEFSARAREAFGTIDHALAALPRGPVRQSIQNARNSYRDGLFWWRKSAPRRAHTVRADALDAPDPLDAADLDASAAAYTVVLNWRGASRYTDRAEQLIRASTPGDIASRH
jgi:hypothetical protein